MNKTDSQLKADIETELSWDPMVNAAQIGVTVQHGAVSLLGSVDSYAQKWAAEDATKRVSGVRVVAQDLAVKVLSYHKHSDSEIAEAVQSALKWNVWVPGSITAQVRSGEVTLDGTTTWKFEREAAEHAVRDLEGVVAVNNRVNISPEASASQVKEKVQAALQRQAANDASSIHVAVSGGHVTLTGTTSSFQSSRDAANAAWSAPGVTHVIDQVKVAMTS